MGQGKTFLKLGRKNKKAALTLIRVVKGQGKTFITQGRKKTAAMPLFRVVMGRGKTFITLGRKKTAAMPLFHIVRGQGTTFHSTRGGNQKFCPATLSLCHRRLFQLGSRTKRGPCLFKCCHRSGMTWDSQPRRNFSYVPFSTIFTEHITQSDLF
jgi:hypothetical protein